MVVWWSKVESRVLPEAFVLLEGHAVTPTISRRWGNSVTGGPQPPKKSPVSLGDGAVNGHVVAGEQSRAQKPPRQSVAWRKSKEKTCITRRQSKRSGRTVATNLAEMGGYAVLS